MDHNKSENTKIYLDAKIKECKLRIKKLKEKRKIVKIVYGTSIVISISASTIVAAVSGAFCSPLLPMIIITSLSTVGTISTAISTKFNLENKKEEYNNVINRLDRLNQRLAYVAACNGSLSEKDSNDIIKEFL